MRYLTGSGVLRLLRSVAECCKSRNALLKVIIEMYVIHYHVHVKLLFDRGRDRESFCPHI